MSSLITRLLQPEAPMNACRYAGVPGHVESYFLRANDPKRSRALWLKTTLYAPLEGEPVAETWFIWFDGEKGTTFAHKDTYPLSEASLRADGEAMDIAVGEFRVALREAGSASGHVRAPEGEASFDLRWTRPASSIARPLSIYPLRLLREGPLPKFKVNTPYPWLVLEGAVTVKGERISVDGWAASQGHNWGREHYFQYAWCQTVFPPADGQPECFVEGGAGRIALRGRTTPLIAVMIVRRGDREFRFDKVLDLWRQDAAISRDRFTLHMSGGDGDARLRADATGRPIAYLGYPNPDRTMTYCLNSKLADVLLEVHPRGEAPFTYRAPHGGALEFIQRNSDPRFTLV